MKKEYEIMKTAVEICNDALAIIGLRRDCTDIEKPESNSDKEFAACFAQVRRVAIKTARPRFACVESCPIPGSPIDINRPEAGVKFVQPIGCLYVQKVDGRTDFTIYGDTIRPLGPPIHIQPGDEGCRIEINYVRDVPDTHLWTDEFDELMAALLAKKTAPRLTKDSTAIAAAASAAAAQLAEYSSLNARDAKIRKKGHAEFKHFWPFPGRY